MVGEIPQIIKNIVFFSINFYDVYLDYSILNDEYLAYIVSVVRFDSVVYSLGYI